MEDAEMHREPDRVPVKINANEHAAKGIGSTIKEILQNPAKAVLAKIAALSMYRMDCTMPYADPHIVGTEEMGATIEYPDNSTPIFRSYPIKSSEDLSKLKVPDPYNDGKIPMVLDVFRSLDELIGDKVFLLQNLNGPFGFAGDLVGPMKLLADVVLNPEFVTELMEVSTSVCLTICKAAQEAGVCPMPFDAMSSPEYISRDAYMRLVYPFQKKVVEDLAPRGCYLGIDGDVRDIIREYGSIGAQGIIIQGFGDHENSIPLIQNDLTFYKSEIGHLTMLIVHFIRARGMLYWTPVQIEESFKDAVGPWAKGGGYAVNVTVPFEANVQNTKAVVRGARRFGRYASIG